MLDPKKCPAFNQGRWYEFFVESDGSSYTMTTSDLEGATISGSYVKMPTGFHVVDSLIDCNNFEVSSQTSVTCVLRQFTDGCQGAVLPSKNNMDWCRLFVFGYFA